MDRIDIEKNILDLSYKRNLQLLNILLITGIGIFFSFIGALILNPEKIFHYTFVIILVGSITYIFYRNIDENFRKISNEITGLTKLLN